MPMRQEYSTKTISFPIPSDTQQFLSLWSGRCLISTTIEVWNLPRQHHSSCLQQPVVQFDSLFQEALLGILSSDHSTAETGSLGSTQTTDVLACCFAHHAVVFAIYEKLWKSTLISVPSTQSSCDLPRGVTLAVMARIYLTSPCPHWCIAFTSSQALWSELLVSFTPNWAHVALLLYLLNLLASQELSYFSLWSKYYIIAMFTLSKNILHCRPMVHGLHLISFDEPFINGFKNKCMQIF